MTHTTLITAAELQALAREGAALMVFDCSFELAQPTEGTHQYRSGHIPGALHADLDQHLSARHGTPGQDGHVEVAGDADRPASGGRHPLPNRERFAAWLSGVGLANGTQAVAYDRNGGMYAARLWWMLQWMGHEASAVLDGGLAAWQAAGGALSTQEEPARFQTHYVPGAPQVHLIGTAEVAARLQDAAQTVVDARAALRYRGEQEPLDPIAGHIPGALNRPFTENFAPDGRYKPAAQLRAEFLALLQGRDPAGVVHQCGSGVTAVPNLLAMRLAGLGDTGLYAGSWSEWSRTPGLPTRRGPQP